MNGCPLSPNLARPRERRRKGIGVAAVGCLASLLAVPAAFAQAPAAAPPKPAAEGNMGQATSVRVPATIEAFFVTDLYAKDSGYISKLNNDIGDHVEKGQELAVIANPELQAQSAKAAAAVQQAMAGLEVAKRQLVGMQAERKLQQLTAKRQKELFAGKAATAQALDDAQAKEGVSVANADTGVAKVAAADADLRATKAEADRLQALLQYDRIVAPFAGVVTRRLVNPGDLVQAATSTRTTPLFTIQKIDQVRVFADVPEASAAGIRPGVPAEVTLFGAAGVTVHGSVTRIASSLDQATRTMRTEIDLPNPDGKLLPGMFAQVTLKLEPQQAADGNAKAATSR